MTESFSGFRLAWKLSNELNIYKENRHPVPTDFIGEDAERLGYNNAAAWKNLIRTHRNEIAVAMKIPVNDFRWYAAFHDEGHHPHIHMMAWSAKAGQAYLSKDGIKTIRSKLTKGENTMKKICSSFDELPVMLTVPEAAVLGISRASAYELAHSKGFPTLTIGSRIVIPKEKLLSWVDENTGK